MSKKIPNTDYDWEKDPHWQDFVEACKSCGLDAYGGEFGDIVLNAKMFFYFGIAAAERKLKEKK